MVKIVNMALAYKPASTIHTCHIFFGYIQYTCDIGTLTFFFPHCGGHYSAQAALTTNVQIVLPEHTTTLCSLSIAI